MEHHDKMKRSRRVGLTKPLIIIILGIVCIAIFPRALYDEDSMICFYSIYLFMIGFGGFAASVIWFRPDFIITDDFIVLSNLPIAYLINKKRFRFELGYEQIENAAIWPDKLVLKSKSHGRAFEVSEQNLDDFQTAKSLILKELARRNIPVNQQGT